eukprot:scaffold7061_cov354-Pinguiococcus_pyrenoidosus.AAC.1
MVGQRSSPHSPSGASDGEGGPISMLMILLSAAKRPTFPTRVKVAANDRLLSGGKVGSKCGRVRNGGPTQQSSLSFERI